MTGLTDEARELALKDAHARYHDQPGNMLGKDDCLWVACEFWDAAVLGFAAGAADMQERAARVAKSMTDNEVDGYYGQACYEVAAAIRALSTTTPEEGNE